MGGKLELLARMNMGGKLELLRSITNKFTEVHIGSGGYGDVYRATLDGKEIAIKKFRQLDGRVDDKEFDNEVLNLVDIEHQNIVRLLGYCYAKEQTFVKHQGSSVPSRVEDTYRVLCFEYMPGGSLHKYISAEEPCHLDWATSYKIIRGICEGLKHLHTVNKGTPIYHMDIKPANILLDKNMTPKIGDLGLSKLVSSTRTHHTLIQKFTAGYVPPEYRNGNPPLVTKKFDVFSLGVIIIQMLAGSNYVSHLSLGEILPEAVTQLVTEKWNKKLQATWGYLSQETAILQVNTCVNIALRCVKADRNERPDIKSIVTELENVEAQIMKMLASDQSKNLIGLQWSSESNVIAVDPALELRLLFEPRKDVSCCLQLTNKTSDYIAFNIKINQRKYYTQPSKGIMQPCSKQYVSVTLRAQEAPQNMPFQDMLHVESVNLSKEPTSSDVEITENFFEKVKTEKVVVTRPIVLVAQDQLSTWTSQKALNSASAMPMDISS